MVNQGKEMATPTQESHVKLSPHALQRLYDGAPGTTQTDIMLASGTLSRESFLGEFFKVRSPEDLPAKE